MPLVQVAVLTSAQKVVLSLKLNTLDTQQLFSVTLQLCDNLACQDIVQLQRARQDIVIFVSLRPIVSVLQFSTSEQHCLIRHECANIVFVNVLLLIDKESSMLGENSI